MKEPGEVSFGEELRRHRLVREVSLESIAVATKISVRYLEALEKGNFQRLPAPVFTRGFIRAYAGYLGLDPEEMVNAYLSETGGPSSRLTASSEEAPGRSHRRPSFTFVAVAALALAVLILIVLGLWRSPHRPRAAGARAPAARAPLLTPPNVQEIPAAAAASRRTETASPSPPTPSPRRPPEAAGPQAPEHAIALTMEFQDDCWVELFADERLIYSGVIRSGEARHYVAENGFRMTLGNAAAARLAVNGRALPPLGKPGKVVRDYRIDLARLESLFNPRG